MLEHTYKNPTFVTPHVKSEFVDLRKTTFKKRSLHRIILEIWIFRQKMYSGVGTR